MGRRINYEERKYKIKELCDRDGITLQQLAQEINVHYLTMSQWSSLRVGERRNINERHRHNIEIYFGIEPHSLLNEVTATT